MYGGYQVTKLSDIAEMEICKIHPYHKLVTKWLPCFIGKMYEGYQVTRLPDITREVICTIHT